MAAPHILTPPFVDNNWDVKWDLVGGLNPSEKYESQLGWLFPIYGKIKNVPNHQPPGIIFPGSIRKYKGFLSPWILSQNLGYIIGYISLGKSPWVSISKTIREQMLFSVVTKDLSYSIVNHSSSIFSETMWKPTN